MLYDGSPLHPDPGVLWRMAEEPILCFDGDNAGRRAAARAAERALPLLRAGKSLRFLALPAGEHYDRGFHPTATCGAFGAAAWLANEVKPDVVHLTNALLSGIVPEIRARMPKVPVVMELQGDDIFLDALPTQARAEAIGLIRANGEQAAGFQATSSYYAEAMSAYFVIGRDRIGVVHPGIDLSSWPTPSVARARPFTVGYFARICPEKGFHHAVTAFIELKKGLVPNAQFHVGGWLGPANKAFFQEQMNKLTTAGMSGDAVHIECPTLADKIAFMNGIAEPLKKHEQPNGQPSEQGVFAPAHIVDPLAGAQDDKEQTQCSRCWMARGFGYVVVRLGAAVCRAAHLHSFISQPPG